MDPNNILLAVMSFKIVSTYFVFIAHNMKRRKYIESRHATIKVYFAALWLTDHFI